MYIFPDFERFFFFFWGGGVTKRDSARSLRARRNSVGTPTNKE